MLNFQILQNIYLFSSTWPGLLAVSVLYLEKYKYYVIVFKNSTNIKLLYLWQKPPKIENFWIWWSFFSVENFWSFYLLQCFVKICSFFHDFILKFQQKIQVLINSNLGWWSVRSCSQGMGFLKTKLGFELNRCWGSSRNSHDNCICFKCVIINIIAINSLVLVNYKTK